MSALIEFVCTAEHAQRRDASITLEPGAWAFCYAGGADGHRWSRIDPTAIEVLRSSGNGRPHDVSDERDESGASSAPAR
jgi:hypothetical protein